jgi:molybdopterin converting factor small subunit
MQISVQFFSYFKDLTGCAQATESIPKGATLKQALEQLMAHYPKLKAMEKSMLVAVGVEYQPREYVLQEADEVSLFPPVQGG